MTTVKTDHPLLIGGDSVETGEWTEVRSPFSRRNRRAHRERRCGRGSARARRRRTRDGRPAARPRAGAHPRRARRGCSTTASRRPPGSISAEAGKPLKAARVEAQRAVSTFTFAAVEARKLAGEMVPMDASAAGAGKLAFTLRLPIGIVGAISPFNFPLNLVAHKIAPALAAGCAVVLKPASATPLSALFLARLEEEAGLPPGWINVVAGSAAAIGDVLVDDERVKLITFTGSGAVGWGLAERAHRKRVKLELGNATPAIVCCDAPRGHGREARRQRASRSPARAASRCSGSSSCRTPGTTFVAEFVPARRGAQGRRSGRPDTDVGPVISEGERDRILEWIASLEGRGADGRRDDRRRSDPPDGDRTPAADRQGAVRGGVRAGRDAHAASRASTRRSSGRTRPATASRRRSSAAIFQTCLRAARELEFGGVTINEAPTFRADQMPYGGVKASGNTKEGPAWAVREMTEERLVVLQL